MINLVAEVGINHNGSLQIALELIRIAKNAGFNYVKFQKRCPELCVPEHQKYTKKETIWGSLDYIQYKNKIEFSITDYLQIDEFCKNIGIQWFASVWDIKSAKEINEIKNDIVKIPSAQIKNHELLKYCRDNFETLIISTGMSDEKDIFEAVKISKPDVIMHSVAIYPTPVDKVNIGYITWLIENYKNKNLCKYVGYSGHDDSIIPSLVAVLYGAEWLEKHVTLSKHMFGSDQSISLQPDDMIQYVKLIKSICEIKKGNNERIILEDEMIKLKQLRG